MGPGVSRHTIPPCPQTESVRLSSRTLLFVSKKWRSHFFEKVFASRKVFFPVGRPKGRLSAESAAERRFTPYTPREKRFHFICRLRAANSRGGLF